MVTQQDRFLFRRFCLCPFPSLASMSSTAAAWGQGTLLVSRSSMRSDVAILFRRLSAGNHVVDARLHSCSTVPLLAVRVVLLCPSTLFLRSPLVSAFLHLHRLRRLVLSSSVAHLQSLFRVLAPTRRSSIANLGSKSLSLRTPHPHRDKVNPS